MNLYTELACWWPLLSPVEDYEEEAGIYVATLKAAAAGEVTTVLELGSGAGNNASFMSREFEMTLVDLSPQMLAVSRERNPGCRHIESDMRTLQLDRLFDAVFIHDAIIYMTTESDLQAVLATAAAHCRKGGALLVMPDHTAETFASTTGHGGADAEDGRGARYLQWAYDPNADDTTYVTLFDVMLRHADGRVEQFAEPHTCGLFPRATWLRLLEEAGFSGRILPFEHSELDEGVCEMIVGQHEWPGCRASGTTNRE